MTNNTSAMVSRLEKGDIQHIFIEFADINGISRSKQLDVEYFLSSWHEGFPMNLLLLFQTPRSEVPIESGFGKEIGYGDGIVYPDPETFRVLPWRDDAARVICDFEYDSEPVDAAPRSVLKRVLEANDFDFDLYAGSELEFYLLDETETGYEPATSHKHECVSWAIEEVTPFYDLLTEWSEGYEIDLHSLQHEHGAGQLEILFKYGTPLSQADTTFDFKRMVKQAASHCDQWATFMAKPFADRAGSGYHLHISAIQGDENVFEDGTVLSERGRYFVGGLLEHADALAAIGTPTLNAFKRYEPNSFAPYTASWGYDNRLTSIRIPPGTTRIENRIASADANPYLVIASSIAAGLHGLRECVDPGEATDGDPTETCPKLPRSPELALTALEDDDILTEYLGQDVIQAYCATKRRELETFYNHVTDWEREQYVETL